MSNRRGSRRMHVNKSSWPLVHERSVYNLSYLYMGKGMSCFDTGGVLQLASVYIFVCFLFENKNIEMLWWLDVDKNSCVWVT